MKGHTRTASGAGLSPEQLGQILLPELHRRLSEGLEQLLHPVPGGGRDAHRLDVAAATGASAR
jgi:hypothetical protein